jgi:type II secretory pathway pseudopilin PulG
MKHKTRHAAYTLVELLVVLGFIATLVGFVVGVVVIGHFVKKSW